MDRTHCVRPITFAFLASKVFPCCVALEERAASEIVE